MQTIQRETDNKTFSPYEEAVFKAYLEENTVKSENVFEFKESNLSYYSSRYTSDKYFSPYEFAHVNSLYHESEEFTQNRSLLMKAKQWYLETVHPSESEYVAEGDKYILHNNLPPKIKKTCEQLKKAKGLDFYTTELLLLYEDKIYQYLPEKEFVFKWKDNMSDRKKEFEQNNGFLFENEDTSFIKDYLLFFPIFVPIKEMLFLGEVGYKSALLKHGAILYYIEYQLNNQKLDYFSNKKLNDWLQIDGVERSVINYFVDGRGSKDGTSKN